ncbi:hypothetical protein TNCV_3557101 [Trichonephila clavipes]|uniref:Uncharacterized protein n=1 Tax=Trichonephila clavipes TaxID=2585209 RepID=A0A8X6WCT0_TRICX|nr:hypothetical protein TNCV_3557101 [Trichonephila clavipes]
MVPFQQRKLTQMTLMKKHLVGVLKDKKRMRKKQIASATVTAGSDVVQSGRPILDDFFQHLWPYIGNNTANVVFQMAKRLWLNRIEQ